MKSAIRHNTHTRRYLSLSDLKRTSVMQDDETSGGWISKSCFQKSQKCDLMLLHVLSCSNNVNSQGQCLFNFS